MRITSVNFYVLYETSPYMRILYTKAITLLEMEW